MEMLFSEYFGVPQTLERCQSMHVCGQKRLSEQFYICGFTTGSCFCQNTSVSCSVFNKGLLSSELICSLLRTEVQRTFPYMCEQVLFVYVSTIIPPRLTDPRNFIYCTDSNPGTGADDAFVLKRGCGVTPHGLHTADRR